MTRFSPTLALAAAIAFALPALAPSALAQEHDADHGRLASGPAAAEHRPPLVVSGQQPGGTALDYRTGDPAAWPPELDAVTAAPGNHRVLLENDRVRVLEVTLAPREVEALHHHRWPSVLYVMEAGPFIDRDADGQVILHTRETKDLPPLPFTMWKEAEAPHAVENLSDAPVRLLRVELKQ